MAAVAVDDSRCGNVTIAVLAAAVLWILAQALDSRHHPALLLRHIGGSGGDTRGAVRGYVVPRPRAFGDGTVFDFVLTADVRSGGDDNAAVHFVGPSGLRWHWTSFHCSFQVISDRPLRHALSAKVPAQSRS